MPLRKAYLAATAMIAVAGFAGLAAAQSKNVHVMTVRLPDGSLEQIRYQGDAVPQIRLEAEPAAFAVLAPSADGWSPFAELERISAGMDREAAAMLQDAQAGPALGLYGANGPIPVAFGRLPPGASGFSMVSTSSGDGVCTRSVQYRSLGDGKAPQVVAHASGDCGGSASGPATHSVSPMTAAPIAPTTGEDSHLVQAAYRTAGG
jgi:hypothetical protein